ncbi:pseudouridine-5'-phosphatase-like [Babylonia areolata]|uniref:pseudouridine-5'-phosphatase-like n=1 Tax=Babylonia areolata TaxID=304850 RepID=UPI003FD5A150
MAETRPKITHVIFDVDGLLLDTESIYTQVISELCAEYGKQFTWELKAKQMGQTEVKAANILIDSLQLPLTAEEYRQKCNKGLSALFPSAPLLPGAERLVKHLHKHGVPMALASGSNRENFELKTQNHGDLFSLFGHSVLSSSDPEVKHGKPAPDCFQVAAARFDPPPKPENVLVFEDAPNGVEAGHAAGMQVVWVPDPRADRSALADKAELILDSLVDFKPEDFGLPSYDS